MSVDLNVLIQNEYVDEYLLMAERFGVEYILTTERLSQEVRGERNPTILPRATLTGRTLSALRTQVNQTRRNSVIIAVPLRGVSVANWAAEDSRIDLLTLTVNEKVQGLKSTTARLAAGADVALEIPIRPILVSSGFERSRILKIYREATSIALDAGMQVVLSSGARSYIEMRSPRAMEFVGTVIGLDRRYSREAMAWALERVKRNVKRLDERFVAPGIEVIEPGEGRT